MEDRDFENACFEARALNQRNQIRDQRKLEEAIHRAQLLVKADPSVVEEIFKTRMEKVA